MVFYSHHQGLTGPTRQTHALTDASAQGKVQHWCDLDVQQMGAGSYQGACATLSSGRMHLVHEQQNRLIHKAGIMPKNTCTVSMALGRDPIRFSHFLEPAPLTFLLPENTEFDILVPAEVDTVYLCLEQDRLLNGARTLNPGFWEHAPRRLHAYNTPDTSKLAACMLSVLNPPPSEANQPSPAFSAQTETLLLDAILLTLNQAFLVLDRDRPECKGLQRARQRVNLAREFMGASLQAGQLPSIIDICMQTGVSARTLQHAFCEVMQMTPVAYLRILRLNKVRSTLQTAVTADMTVTQVAMLWGFLHLGEFARDYRRLFGERPSETLACARIRHRDD
jgi:AraC family ethanolamine operon transcriptional activator